LRDAPAKGNHFRRLMIEVTEKVPSQRLHGGRQGVLGRVDPAGVTAQRHLGIVVEESLGGVADQARHSFQVPAQSNPQHLAGAEWEDHRDGDDGEPGAQRVLLQAEDQEVIGELAQLHVQLGHHDRDADDHERVIDSHEVHAEEQRERAGDALRREAHLS
jgi:hypothetical protein